MTSSTTLFYDLRTYIHIYTYDARARVHVYGCIYVYVCCVQTFCKINVPKKSMFVDQCFIKSCSIKIINISMCICACIYYL